MNNEKEINPQSISFSPSGEMSVGQREAVDDFESILIRGINFGRGGEKKDPNAGKVKTKAKKKKYITGAHGSGSARQKAKYREQRANRHK